MKYTIREFRGLEDARPQYELWLRATEGLPRAWRSCLRNVEHQLMNGRRYPKCRLYAERANGELIGYIGTHPPFEWKAEQHGPPVKSLGWAIPFGYPWTNPHDPALESALYEEMIRVTPEVYAEFPRDLYIQRFRASWSRPIAFLEQRGWRLHDRLPLFGRQFRNAGPPPDDIRVARAEDMELVSTLAEADATAVEKPTAEDLRRRHEAGWIVSDTFYCLGERGAFALEPRGRWAAVTLYHARPQSWKETLEAAAATAGQWGADEVYFTIEPHEAKRRSALEGNGFSEVDAGVYYVRDAD